MNALGRPQGVTIPMLVTKRTPAIPIGKAHENGSLPKSVLLGASNSQDSLFLATSNSPALAASKLRVQTKFPVYASNSSARGSVLYAVTFEHSFSSRL